ncbi:MAG: trypsin-like peptidase domain-containing protein [Clostridia bacterium]|nr:trypsin-like peptidase domain-containing protein [Clostridia bacterium]
MDNNYNSYNSQNGYNGYTYSAQQNGNTGISYAPRTAKKEKSSVPVALISVICVATILLSGIMGFGGAYLANSFTGSSKVQQTVQTADPRTYEDPAVIYKTVDISTEGGSTEGKQGLTYSQVADMVKDSVVEISTEMEVRSSWFNAIQKGAGSGVVISEDGYIITNAHVITGDGTTLAKSIVVRLHDSTEYEAKVVGYDIDADIAVLKIDAEGLTPAVIGNSDALVVGEEVIAVGNPLGTLGGTVTNGIISAKERTISVEGNIMTLLQHSASISPGNSGGGLFNMRGELVAIVNAKSTRTDTESIGFAIPVKDALETSEQLLQYGYVRGKPDIGVGFETVTSTYMSFFYDIKPGIYVSALVKGYNDDVLKTGDRVIAVNDQMVTSSGEIDYIVKSSSVGDKIKFQVERDGRSVTVDVTVYESVPDPDSDISFNSGDQQ